MICSEACGKGGDDGGGGDVSDDDGGGGGQEINHQNKWLHLHHYQHDK